MQRLRSLVLVGLVGIVLAAPGLARADGYWFFSGTLPTPDGTRTVLHHTVCCPTLNKLRMSWQPGTHTMNFVFVARNGNWDFFESYGYDVTVPVLVGNYGNRAAGCQNPWRSGYYAVWTNCHLGLS